MEQCPLGGEQCPYEVDGTDRQQQKMAIFSHLTLGAFTEELQSNYFFRKTLYLIYFSPFKFIKEINKNHLKNKKVNYPRTVKSAPCPRTLKYPSPPHHDGSAHCCQG